MWTSDGFWSIEKCRQMILVFGVGSSINLITINQVGGPDGRKSLDFRKNF